jgi:hypothetical protein
VWHRTTERHMRGKRIYRQCVHERPCKHGMTVRPIDRFSVCNCLAAKEGARRQHYARNLVKHSERKQMLKTGLSTNEKITLIKHTLNQLFV